VSHIILKHSNDHIQPQMFSLKPKWNSFKAKILKLQALSTLQVNGSEQLLLLQMKATQLPILINNASTGAINCTKAVEWTIYLFIIGATLQTGLM
jgi:hypothetical protein